MPALQHVLRTLLSQSHNIHTHHIEDHLESLEAWEQIQLLLQLLCVRLPSTPLSSDILLDIDSIIKYERNHRILTRGVSIPPIALLKRSRPANIRLWKGDITTLASDVTAITNAANSQMLGCFQPSHKCIDNVIHSWAGPRLREECFDIMTSRGRELPVGEAVVTGGYCLPTPFVIHTVGPQLDRGVAPTNEQRQQLRQCYVSVLDAAESLPCSADGTKRIALCGISTGLFAFPAHDAAVIAVETVKAWFAHHEDTTVTDIIFVTYTDTDHSIYNYLLGLSKSPWVPIPQGPVARYSIQGESLSLARRWLQEAEAVIVSAGAGLSAADGLDYTSESLFKKHFPTFRKYQLYRLYDVFGFTGWPSEHDRWSYYFTHLEMIRSWPRSDLYKSLIAWLSKFGPDAYVRTSNADGLFVANGWDENQISTPQGQYAVLQCLANCRPDSTCPSLPWLDAALPALDPKTQRLNDPSKVPKCLNCSGAMNICVRAASWFNDRPFRAGEDRWRNFRRSVLENGKKTVILELGVGLNTPGVLRWPNEDLVRKGQGQVKLIRVGMGPSASVPFELEEGGLAANINADIKLILNELISSHEVTKS
ncbi:macro domain-like protein [Zopfia rhizophila CBS 207.26]|uniref:Macro domain-like protein n=1 Tax=Zopfia rhizophila CBS 207.26 TaxID=1314779 RepID=A0A6A6EAH9_9PEZI|nr:macro domain-like protein [Zopfia rhizophila CBS 207.26]